LALPCNAVDTLGIHRIAPQDVAYAGELGYRIKHLGVARQTESGMELRVHPTLIPERRLLANVDGVRNAILVMGDAVGPTLYYGAGAGGSPTASGVVADLIDLARDIDAGQSNRIAPLGHSLDALRELPVVPMQQVETPWYLRMEAEDKPGVLSRIATLLSDQGISIEALIQKAPLEGQTRVPVVVLTNRAAQSRVDVAVQAIEALATICGEITRIRVETLDG